jgi:SET domain-containing protein
MATIGYDLARSSEGAVDRSIVHLKRHESEHMMDCVNSRDSLADRTETSYSKCHVKEVANPRTISHQQKPNLPFSLLVS